MTTIAGFLLARIAEDEADAEDAHHERCGFILCSDCTTGPFPCDCGRPARVLAECEAKRRIINLAQVWIEDEPATWSERAHVTAYRDVLRSLAQVYADHPDFDPSWA